MSVKISAGNITRRDCLRFGVGAMGVVFLGSGKLSGVEAKGVEAGGMIEGFVLPPLDYPYDALEPVIDAATMQIHHTKHHQAYIDNAMKLLEQVPALGGKGPLDVLQAIGEAPEDLRQRLIDNVGGHINHSLFWKMMAPVSGQKPEGSFGEALERAFGGFENFKQEFERSALARFGSGWAWLVRDRGGNLRITSTPNQNPPQIEGHTPLLGVDVWEHAYYLKYQNRRAEYLSAWWGVVNWRFVEAQFETF